MPVNTSSTGATYGKSSDPLCPLGFHPQVRWPTRCKRCFRDYKEHSDANDKAKYKDTYQSSSEGDPWSNAGYRSGFTKARSLDVNIDLSSRTMDLPMPEWKKRMLERQKKEEEENNSSRFRLSSSDLSTSSTRVRNILERSKSAQPENYSYTRSSSLYSMSTQKPEEKHVTFNEMSAQKAREDSKKLPEKTWKSSTENKSVPLWSKDSGSSTEESVSTKNYYSTDDSRSSWKKDSLSSSTEDSKLSWKKDSASSSNEDSTIPSWKKKDSALLSKSAISNPEPVIKKAWKRSEPVDKVVNAPKEQPSGIEKSSSKLATATSSSSETTLTGAKKKKKKPVNKADSSDDDINISNKKPLRKDSISSVVTIKSESKETIIDKDIQLDVKPKQEVSTTSTPLQTSPTTMTFDSHKASETVKELLAAKEQIRDQESQLADLMKEKKSNFIKIKELSLELEKRPVTSETQKVITELQTKYSYIEKKCAKLEAENDSLLNNVQNLEGELEEVQDNFREDEADEYRNLKRELEMASKNCRVLQFKLKKSEKMNGDLELEKIDLETRIKNSNGGDAVLESVNKIKSLEKSVEEKSKTILKLENDLKCVSKQGGVKTSSGPVSRRTGSIEKGFEDQLVKDLQDSIERENDLKEQLTMAEEETTELRKKLSRIEDENESLTSQVKKLSAKAFGTSKKRSPSPYKVPDKDEGISEDGEELSVAELKVQMEVADQESSSLRKKVETLLTENLKLSKELKELSAKLSDEKKKKTSPNYSLPKTSESDALQNELNETRIKLIEKEREFERADSQLKLAMSRAKLRRSGSGDEDLLKKLEVIQKEAEVLRNRNLELESERMSSGSSSKLLDQVRNLESKLESAKDSEKRSVEKLNRELKTYTEKYEKIQRDFTSIERDKRKADEQRTNLASTIQNLEIENKNITRERDRLKYNSESALQKNKDYLEKTQEGVKSFKDQIDKLQSNLSEERNNLKELRISNDKKIQSLESELKSLNTEKDELKSQCSDLEEKWAKSKRINNQKKDKIEALEKQLENKSKDDNRIRDLEKKKFVLEKEKDNLAVKIKSLQGGDPDAQNKFDLMEERFVTEKAQLVTEKEELSDKFNSLSSDYETIKGELSALRSTYNTKADTWIREKLDLQQNLKDLQESMRSSAGEGWDNERERFKNIIEDRDSQITQLKIEDDVSRSQMVSLKKENDDLKYKLADYEKMSKFQKAVHGSSSDSSDKFELQNEVEDLKKKLNTEQKEKRTEVNNIKIKYDAKVALLEEELTGIKAQCTKYKRERESYKEKLEGVTKKNSGYSSSDAEANEFKSKYKDISYQVQILEDELADAKLVISKTNAKYIGLKNESDIKVAELNSKINELEEEALIDSGRSRIAGSRTKMELAWQKERESQKKLINELNTMARDLKSTLIEVEKDSERNRLDSKRKIEGMKKTFEEEQEDTKKQITDLQYDLLELRDAHAKLRTTNEKLRRDKGKSEKEREEYRTILKDKSRAELSDEKNIAKILKDMDEFLNTVPKFLGKDFMSADLVSRSTNKSASDTSAAKAEFKSALMRFKDSKEELSEMKKSFDQSVVKKSLLNRIAPGDDKEGSPKVIRPSRSGTNGSRTSLYRRTVSIGETISEAGDSWKGESNAGSRESLNSNASIPLPVPVRTRSAIGPGGHGSESGYSSESYNIRRLERDTSVDRVSTGSRESNLSTQSEWVRGEQRRSSKKMSLIGKLKKLTKSKPTEKEFGSGSDISSTSKVSISSSASTFQKMQALKKERSVSKERKSPAEANAPFDKYFTGQHSTTQSGSHLSTLPRTSRRF